MWGFWFICVAIISGLVYLFYSTDNEISKTVITCTIATVAAISFGVQIILSYLDNRNK